MVLREFTEGFLTRAAGNGMHLPSVGTALLIQVLALNVK